MATEMTYGDYTFSPVPFMRLSLAANRLGNGQVVGFTWASSLSGDLVDVSTEGIVKIDELQDALSSAIYLQPQGSNFYVSCGGSPLLDVYPRIATLSFEQGNWVNRSPYTIDMEWDILVSGISDYISDYKEDWAFEFTEDKNGQLWTTLEAAISNGELASNTPDYLPFQARITHNVSATGKSAYGSGGLLKPAYQQARAFVNARLVSTPDSEFVENSGAINFFPANVSGHYFNHVRTVSTDETAGTYAVAENWLMVAASGALVASALEDFTIDIKQTIDSPYKTVGINGTIQGLETRTYGSAPGDFSISETKYTGAITYWNTIRSRLYTRCRQLSGTTLNPIATSTSNGYNPYTGTITYSNEYNNRPSNCLTIGNGPQLVTSESINLTDNNGGDLFASVFVLGKASGPVLQALGTRSIRTRSLSIESYIAPSNICPTSVTSNILALRGTTKPGNVDAVVQLFEDELVDYKEATQVFRTEDSETYNIKEGRYSRQVTWSWAKC